MNNQTPKVSIIALCYNHANYVVECLESIRKQTYPYFELIIVDDCSTDHSVSVIQQWISDHQMPCQFIIHSVNKGICKSLNEVLSKINGEFVAITSTDDVWLKDKLQQQITLFQHSSAETGIVYSDAFQINAESKPIEGNFIQSHRKFVKMPEGNLFSTLVKGNFIPAPTVLIKRSCYETVGNYDEELCFEDYDMWLRIAQHYTFVFSPIPTVNYRLLDSSLTRKKCEKLDIQKYESNIRISKKFLNKPEIKGKDRKNLNKMLAYCVYNLSERGLPHMRPHLKYMMQTDPSIITAFFLFLNIINVPLAIQSQIIASLRKGKKYLKSLLFKKNVNQIS